MNVNFDFGVVKTYLPDRGFGFVSRTFLNTRHKEVFFHISNLKKKNPELAKKLASGDSTESIYFWYEFEYSNKGDQVRSILESKSICQIEFPNVFVDKIERLWRNVDLKIPDWLKSVSLDLLGDIRTCELISERSFLILVKEKKEAARIKELMEEMERRNSQQKIEDNEFEQLVTEIMSFNFTHTAQVSSYIKNHNLGYKYKNISGIVKMEKEGKEWNFDGGFPPKIYARLCSRLELDNNQSGAKVVGFEYTYKDNKES